MTQISSTGKVVMGQIHDNGAGGIDDEPLIKVEYVYNSTKGTGTWSPRSDRRRGLGIE